jgi:hypothetical protein
MGISTESNPHFLYWANRRVLSFVKGEVNRKVLMPKFIRHVLLETQRRF